MITIDDVRSFVNTAGADFADSQIQEAITLAEERAKNLLVKTGQIQETDPLPNTPQVKKALILLSVAELASQVNLYWRGSEKTELIRVRDLLAEVERLLNITPFEVPVKWQQMISES